jgi:hypothetical protein
MGQQIKLATLRDIMKTESFTHIPGQKYAISLLNPEQRQVILDFGERGSVDITAPIGTDIIVTAGQQPFSIILPDNNIDATIRLVDNDG